MTPDWTSGAAKWAAVIVLGGSSVAGIAWTIARGSGPAWEAPPSRVGSRPLEVPSGASGVDPSPEAPPGTTPVGQPTPGPARLLIDLNTATQAELELLPGVGEVLARAIVDDRARRGRFRRVEDLDRVSGIGPKTIERLRVHVRVDP